MKGRKLIKLPARLANVREQFAHWRSTHPARSRIPDALWARAVKLADTYGVCRTARTLRLDYSVLKKRLVPGWSKTTDLPAQNTAATFVELPASLAAGFGECTLEWEATDGAKLRVHWKGGAMPDLAALSQSFWSRGP